MGERGRGYRRSVRRPRPRRRDPSDQSFLRRSVLSRLRLAPQDRSVPQYRPPPQTLVCQSDQSPLTSGRLAPVVPRLPADRPLYWLPRLVLLVPTPRPWDLATRWLRSLTLPLLLSLPSSPADPEIPWLRCCPSARSAPWDHWRDRSVRWVRRRGRTHSTAPHPRGSPSGGIAGSPRARSRAGHPHGDRRGGLRGWRSWAVADQSVAWRYPLSNP